MPLGSTVMSRANIQDLLERGIRKVYISEYDLIDNQFEIIYNVKDSVKQRETDVYTAGLGFYSVKPEGQAPTFDTSQEAWKVQFTHQTYALGIEITREGMEDDLYGYYMSMGGELGKAGAYTQQVAAMDTFNNLSNTIYTAGGTNYTLLSTAQFRVDGGSWGNRPTIATDLSIESLETALAAWRTGMLDQRGRKLTVRPSVLMVGPSDEFLAERLLATDKRPTSADNDVNTVKTRRNLTLFVADFLTDDGRWFLLADKPRTGLVYNLRAGREIRRADDPRTDNMLMIGRYRESHGATHPYGIYGSP